MKKLFALAAAASMLLAGAWAIADAKRPLNHNDFDSWQKAQGYALSDDGRWAAYAVVPQEGDGVLTLRDNRSRRVIEVARGYKPRFTADGRYAVALIKPLFSETRQAKIKKKKDFDLPQDSLAIVTLETGHIEKIPSVIDFKIGKEGGDWLAYRTCDTLYIKPKELKDKEAGRPLVVRDLSSPARKTVKRVKHYDFSRDGRRLALTMTKSKKDSLATSGVALINLPDTSMLLVDRDQYFYGEPVFDRAGSQLAYIASQDTAESGTRQATLWYLAIPADDAQPIPSPRPVDYRLSERQPINLALPHADDPKLQARLEKERKEAIRKSEGEVITFNQYSRPEFSYSGRRLIVGAAPVVAPDDTTLVDFERPTLDIWRWDSELTPPQEKKRADKSRKHTYPVVYDIAGGFGKPVLVTDKPYAVVDAPFRWDGDFALVHDPTERMTERQWNYLAPERLTLVDLRDDSRRELGEADNENSWLSPEGKYVLTYRDRQFRCYDIARGEYADDIAGAIPYPIWEEDDDHPMPQQPYGIAGWTEGDADLLPLDRHDIWSVDPRGLREPICLTDGRGRKENLRLRYKKLDPEEIAVKPGQTMVLEVFDYKSKENGLATVEAGKPKTFKIRTLGEFDIYDLKKARNADSYMWNQGNFSVMPDLRISRSTDFAKGEKVTSINPQLKDISWGTAELVSWHAYDGTPLEGVLYKPEGFDESAEAAYPLLSVFYERAAEDLYRHYEMQPSWSWVNYPFYVSRGYVVFVPDIVYKAGVPGECAWNCVCSGVEELCRRYNAIDPKRLGIDGQSWGGYQTAYLVTRTDMFACAGSGAPVANMTSAFGGIRWESGDSRQGQYEMGQSRIGQSLFEAPELYIANSPVFKADRVHTPLLIMHNDADGAVPWYQGIEMFMALRRLQKPVWMLQYNGEAHNIKERRNRKDITVRLQQFFDHYLKGEPMPRWMKDGVRYTRKTQDLGY